VSKTVALLATLDTKGQEVQFLAQCIQQAGHQALVVDVGVIGTSVGHADVTNDQVAVAGGTSLAELRKSASRERAAPVMAAGASKILTDLAARGKAHAIVALGGTQGTTLCTAVMRALPYGFPKIMVSTMASGNVAQWVDTKDITMMYSVTDIMGLNPFMCRILANAAAAACGMAEVDLPPGAHDKLLIAVTTVGITTQGAMKAVEVLEQAGFDTIVFHAVGTGGRAMEEMMQQGLIDAVLDFSLIEVSNEMYHALLAGGPSRLTCAGRLGLPQVICPGAVEVLVFNEPDSVPAKYRDRTLVRHSPQITDLRLNRGEMAEVGREVARRLRETTDKAVCLIPTAGYDSYAVAGGPFHDPQADAAFVTELRANSPKSVDFRERDTHINDPIFAREAAESLVELIRQQARAK
jgi:uncharacterized protein (UPF0261 family)